MRLAFAALIAICTVADAAPVPPPPPLTEAVLVGEWRLWIGPDLTNIRLVLSADGTYTEQYTDPGAILTGRWWVHRGWVVLESPGGSQVAFTMDPRTFQGRTPNQWVVKLSKPVRP